MIFAFATLAVAAVLIAVFLVIANRRANKALKRINELERKMAQLEPPEGL